jgi:predicted PurR-regulated permease PerM
MFLHLLVASFAFFFALRDHEEIVEYVRSLLPFSKDVEKKLFDYTKGITNSVIYGQIVIGLIQGVISGLGFFIFGVPNALLLTLLATLAGVLPIIGTGIVVVPVVAYLFLAGNTVPAIGVSIFGIISSTIDNILRPIIVSRRTQIHSAIILIGMISGLFLFGVLGLILGPLILAYLIIILEIYRKKRSPEFLIKNEGCKKS